MGCSHKIGLKKSEEISNAREKSLKESDPLKGADNHRKKSQFKGRGFESPLYPLGIISNNFKIMSKADQNQEQKQHPR